MADTDDKGQTPPANNGGDDKDKDKGQTPPAPNNDDKGDDKGDGKKLPETVPYNEFAESRKALKEAKDLLKKFEDEKKAADDQKLKDNEQYKELSEKKDAELAELKSKHETALKKVKFSELALKEGVVNVDDAFRLADLSGITVSDDGTIAGMDEVVSKLKDEKDYLFGAQDKSMGGGSNPPKNGDEAPDGKRIYRRSEVTNPEFYAKHKDDIPKAFAEGRVVED